MGRAGKGRNVATTAETQTWKPLAKVPRSSQLMPLAIKFDRLVRDGVVADYSELARLGQVIRDAHRKVLVGS